ncbi:preprotein translocase subunit SecA [Candidatus Marinimicrobia bacterium]|nr:preprotein translocase subunit SecA [Candidatus Neomarinimicrobiota bacterium]
MAFLAKIFGTKSDREIKKILPIVNQVNQFYDTLKDKDISYLQSRTKELQVIIKKSIEEEESKKLVNIDDSKELKKIRSQITNNVLEHHLIESFALVKHACKILYDKEWEVVGQKIKWEMIPYDEQIIGGVVLHQGKISEMKTGEGKTLVATFPIYLNALSGRGVHVITVNDYLAQRDAEWMGKVFETLGLTVGFILNSMNPEQRKSSYNCDITYGTNNEFGFDYLRDNMTIDREFLVQRKHNYAIVDEVDSVLIDEARTPLIISGPVETKINQSYVDLKKPVQSLVVKQTQLISSLVSEAQTILKNDKLSDDDKQKAGLLLLKAKKGLPKFQKLQDLFQEQGTIKMMNAVESEYIAEKKTYLLDEDLLFSIDEQSNSVDLSDKGREALSPDNKDAFTIPDLGELLSDIDEQNLSDEQKQLQKEKVYKLHSERSSKIHYLSQLLKAYTLFDKDVEYVVQNGQVLIVDEFTGRVLPGRRFSGGLHQALEAKENVKIEKETQTLASITIQNYFRMYDKLSGMTGTADTEAAEFEKIYNLGVTVIPTHRPIKRNDFNDVIYKSMQAKYKAVIKEVSEYYAKGQPVLIGTVSVEVSELLSKMLKQKGIPHNVLNAKQHQSEAQIVSQAGLKKSITIATNMAGRGTDIKLGPGVEELGGLHIIGTARHESRRIDLQLMGRSGRQGDNGSSRFYISLEDDLMRLFNMDRLATYMDRLSMDEDQELSAGMLNRGVSNAQKKVEERNFAMRKHLLEYDDVLNQQREIIYDLRNKALLSDSIKDTINEFIEDFIFDIIGNLDFKQVKEWDWQSINQQINSNLMVNIEVGEIESLESLDELIDYINEEALKYYKLKEDVIPSELLRKVEKFIVLKTIDEKWRNHLLGMDQLREGIGLRAYGQKNPLIEYKSESYNFFQELMVSLRATVIQRVFHAQVSDQVQSQQNPLQKNIQLQHDEVAKNDKNEISNEVSQQHDSSNNSELKLGRNDKVELISPSGERVKVKFKKIDQYLMKGYTRG